MFKGVWVSTFILLILSIGCLPQPAEAPTQKQVLEEIGNASAALVLHHGDEVRVYCTAVWISKDTLLTANHCVEAAYESWQENHKTDDDSEEKVPSIKEINYYYIVRGENDGVGKEPTGIHLAKAISLDKKHDLALLKVSGKLIPPHAIASLASNEPEIGEHVFVLGHVTGLYWTHVECVVSAFRESLPLKGLNFSGPFTQLSGPIYFGNSGGGAFNNKGELIGIASFITRAPNTAMFISLESIKNFLNKK
jgi:hypothetical protein